MKLAAAAGLLLALLGAARADSWAPYGERLAVAENGKHYLVLGPPDYEKGRTAFALRARVDGTKPPRVVEDPRADETTVVVDPGDRLVRKGDLAQQPLEAWVLSATPRAVLFEEYANVGGGTTLSLLQADGTLKWRHALDAFGFDPAKFRRSTSSVWWNESWWVDEGRGRIVLVAKGGQVREVELESGAIHRAEGAVVLAALDSPSVRVRSTVLRLCARADEKPRGWIERVRAFRDDESQPPSTRLEAAWALSRAGDGDRALAIFRAARKHLADEGVRIAYLHRAPEMFAEEESAPLLAALLRAQPEWRPRDVAGVLGDLGTAGIEALDEIAADEALSQKHRVAALFGLGNSRSAHGAAAFVYVLREADDALAAAALAQFEDQIIPPLERALANALRYEGAGDTAIAKYLGDHASADHVEGLEAARKRAPPDSAARAAIDAALEKCRARER